MLKKVSLNNTSFDTVFFIVLGIFILQINIFFLINSEFEQNKLLDFAGSLLNRWAVVALSLGLLGFFMDCFSPNVKLVFKTVGMLYLSAFFMLLGDGIIITTPFHLMDRVFYHVDHLLGFNLVDYLLLVKRYNALNFWYRYFYHPLSLVALLVPLCLAACNQRMQVYRYIIAMVIAQFIGFFIYYFLPTTSPAAVIHNYSFSLSQQLVVTQFHKVHQPGVHLHFMFAGLIGFPSFHAAWSVLIAYVLWQYKSIRWLGVCYAVCVMLSAMLMGWHFLVDILGGVIVAMASNSIARYALTSFRPMSKSERALC